MITFDQLTDYQLNIVNNIIQKLQSQSIIQISGPPGVGKTSIAYHIKNKLLSNFQDIELAICAPTNKAKEVLISKGLSSASTIYSKFSSKKKYTENGEMEFKLPKKCSLKGDFIVLILDETSMIKEQDYNVLMSYNIKIITFGDRCQLPPIYSKRDKPSVKNISPFYYYHSIDYELTENLRNERFEFNKKLQFLRNLILNDKKLWELKDIICNDIRYSRDILRRCILALKLNINCIILCFTNKRVEYYNDVLRKSLFNKEDENNEIEKYLSGERMIFTNFFSYNDEIQFYTQQSVIIDEVNKSKYYCEYTKREYNVYELILNIKETNVILRRVQENSLQKFEDNFKEKRIEIYHEKDFGVSKEKLSNLWGEYWKHYHIINAPIDYGYSITIHKSQGSSWENVYIDSDLFNWNTSKVFLKLLYVAISRSEKKCFILENEF